MQTMNNQTISDYFNVTNLSKSWSLRSVSCNDSNTLRIATRCFTLSGEDLSHNRQTFRFSLRTVITLIGTAKVIQSKLNSKATRYCNNLNSMKLHRF